MPLARARMGRPGVVGPRPVARTAATVGTVAVVAHGVNRRSDRREDRRPSLLIRPRALCRAPAWNNRGGWPWWLTELQVRCQHEHRLRDAGRVAISAAAIAAMLPVRRRAPEGCISATVTAPRAS